MFHNFLNIIFLGMAPYSGYDHATTTKSEGTEKFGKKLWKMETNLGDDKSQPSTCS